MKKVLLFLLLCASSASAEFYTWKDRAGTVFYTNSLHEIPARYRSRAMQLDVATGKKLPISAAGQPAGTAAPTTTAAPPAPLTVAAPVPAPTPPPAPTPAAGQPGSAQQLRTAQPGTAEQRPGFTIAPNNPAPTPAVSSTPRMPAPKPRTRPARVRNPEDE